MNGLCFFPSYVSRRRRHTRVECIAGPRLRVKFLSCFTPSTTCFKTFTFALSLIRVQCGRIPSSSRTFYLFSVFFTVFYLFLSHRVIIQVGISYAHIYFPLFTYLGPFSVLRALAPAIVSLSIHKWTRDNEWTWTISPCSLSCICHSVPQFMFLC